jgi:hypothetical protein
MKKLVIVFAVLLLAATGVTAYAIIERQRSASTDPGAAEKYVRSDPDFGHYDATPGTNFRTYDLSSEVTLKRGEARARLVFNLQDDGNYHYVEITPRWACIAVVQNGIGRILEEVKGLSIPTGRPVPVVIKRRDLAIRLIVDDTVVAEACDETFHTGMVGYGVAGDSASATMPKAQPVGEVWFADDFMRAEKEKNPWTELKGRWTVSTLTNTSMSVNAFQYVAEDQQEDAVSVAGYGFWDDYSFETAVKATKPKPFGIYVCYRDENNYFRLELSPGEEGKPGRKELVRVWHGERKVVARQAGGFTKDQWYLIRCQVNGTRLRAWVDENLLFDVLDSHLTGGMVGLYASAKSRTFFDDVFVRSCNYFEDRFTTPTSSAWCYLGGKWSRVRLTNGKPASDNPASAEGILTVSSPGSARAVAGASSWKNYVVDTRITPDRKGRTGLVLCYQDETRYYEVACRSEGAKETWALTLMLDGKATTLDEQSVDASAGARPVQAGIRDGCIWVNVNGKRLLEAFDTKLQAGQVGLAASGVERASFSPLTVDWPIDPAPLLTSNEIFEEEDSMSNWSTPKSYWQYVESPAPLWLHKGNFPGDALIETGIRNLTGPGAEVGLVLSAAGANRDTGYVFRLKPGDKESFVVITREGKEVAKETLNPGTKAENVGFKRVGGCLIGFVNREPVISFRDRAALKGDRLGWFAAPVSSKVVDVDAVAVTSPNVRSYLFRKAITDWRIVSGTWEASNRWQCDPRWTFFSGRSWKLAAIWNKRSFKGDVTADFYCGPKMDRDRGDHYEYAADFNCTLNGDGNDLTSGYSFLFGGFDDKKTVLMKGTQVLAENTSVVIPRESGIHRRWFHVKAENKGGHLRMWVDDQLVIDTIDKDPLKGDRVALWTWNNGMMVGRVALSGLGSDEFESPDAVHPVKCRTVYDAAAAAASKQ